MPGASPPSSWLGGSGGGFCMGVFLFSTVPKIDRPASCMVVTAAVRRSLRISGRLVPADVRLGQVAVTLVVSIALFLLALHVPAFMAAGADMTDSAQRDYAANIWHDAQTRLALGTILL